MKDSQRVAMRKPKRARVDLEKSQKYVRKKAAGYLDRVLARFPSLDYELLKFLYWLLEPDMLEELVSRVAEELDPGDRKKFRDEMQEGLLSEYDFAQILQGIFKKTRKELESRTVPFVRKLIKRRVAGLSYGGRSEIEKSRAMVSKMFRLDNLEAEICVLLFIISEWHEVEALFEDHYHCTYYSGRNYLSTMMAVSDSEIAGALNGRLTRMGIIETEEGSPIKLESSLGALFQIPAASSIRTEFFKRIYPSPIPLEAHMMEEEVTNHVLGVLKASPSTATHVLIYGPPGTGKTSYGHGIAKALGLPVFEVDHGTQESLWKRMAAITACINLTSNGPGALILADDSDVILNTAADSDGYGDVVDKKWLHDILEEPGVRMIWIVNDIDDIEESVMRRFAFSVRFRPFSREKRIQLWANIVARHKVKRFLKAQDIIELAGRFQSSPGAVDQAVRKAKDTRPANCADFRKAVSICLEAHECLLNGGSKGMDSLRVDPVFSLAGLNVKGANLETLLEELERFNEYLKNPNPPETFTMRLLLHGPPGTGKTRFARYVAERLDREVTCKRASDILSKWVGESEQNIRSAYEEATAKEAVLIFDEADSLIMTRERATHGWEISLTNEFLSWMEEFKGIQIFTTNRLRDLDTASIRRFNYKLEFRYLKPEGNLTFYHRMLSCLAGDPFDQNVEDQLKGLSRLTPGDFKAVRDRFAFRDSSEVTHQDLVNALRQEERIKALHAGEKALGFLARDDT